MPKIRKTVVLDDPSNNRLGNQDFKIQLSADGSGQYVDVVAIDGTSITVDTLNVGTVDLVHNTTPPSLANGQTSPIQGDSAANLKTTLATALPAGSNTIGKVDQGAGGASAWKVDPSGVTSPVSAASLPLPANAAQETGGNLATLAGAVSAGKVQATVATALPAGANTIGAVNQGTSPWVVQEPSISGAAAITPSDSVTVSAGRQFLVNCTVAGNVKVAFSNSSTLTIPISVGMTLLPWAIIQVFVTGTTATSTYANLS